MEFISAEFFFATWKFLALLSTVWGFRLEDSLLSTSYKNGKNLPIHSCYKKQHEIKRETTWKKREKNAPQKLFSQR